MNSKPAGYRCIDAIAMLFVSVLLISNTIAVKVIDIGPFSIAAGIVCFPIAYIFGDVLTEVYGYARTRRIIWFGFACLAMMSFFYWSAVQLVPAAFWDTPLSGVPDGVELPTGFHPATRQDALASILGFAPRIAMASFLAYLTGSFLNSFVMSRMKVKMAGRHLWMRTIGSTIVGEGADSIVFAVVAWAFIFSWFEIAAIAVSGFALKTAYEVLSTPLTYIVVGWLKRVEGVDHYDVDVSYNPFVLK